MVKTISCLCQKLSEPEQWPEVSTVTALGLSKSRAVAPKGVPTYQNLGAKPLRRGHRQVQPTMISQCSSSVAQLWGTSAEAGIFSSICMSMIIQDLVSIVASETRKKFS